MQKIIALVAAFVFNLAMATPYGGFTKFLLYEPEVPETLTKKKQNIF